jgi:hypothetical protein
MLPLNLDFNKLCASASLELLLLSLEKTLGNKEKSFLKNFMFLFCFLK